MQDEKSMTTEESSSPGDGGRGAPANVGESKQRALALGLEFARRAMEAGSLDELLFLLTNDLRILAEFDRALLITHFKGRSTFAAATNQPIIEKKHSFAEMVEELASRLKTVKRGIWLSSGETDRSRLEDEGLDRETQERLLGFMETSGCSFLLCVPLVHNDRILAHLLLEFHEDRVPSQIQILTLLGIAPFFAAALAEKQLTQVRPRIWDLIAPEVPGAETRRTLGRRLTVGAAILLLVVLCLFLFKLNYTVGGECEVIPKEKHFAFVKMEGIVRRIHVTEGKWVEAGQVIALLDSTELDHETESAARKLEILTREMVLLRRESGADPSKLAESALVKLKRKAALEKLKFLKQKRRYLEVRAPVSGIVVTKEVDSLEGKRFSAGEPFCEIAAPGELWVAIDVPEDGVSLVRKGQGADVYLNSEPGLAHRVRVAEIAPVAETRPRLGSFYRVRAPLAEPTKGIRVGMKGIGKIYTGKLSLYRIIARRLARRWNELSLYF